MKNDLLAGKLQYTVKRGPTFTVASACIKRFLLNQAKKKKT